jgi:DNA repair photolyase
MGLVKAKGNMYPWVTHVHTHLGGECPHKCTYCYAQKGVSRMSGKYKGPLRLVENELKVNYGRGRVIFLEHMNDLFAEGVRYNWLAAILGHAWKYPDNLYVLQTKNPSRAMSWFYHLPRPYLLGTTLETNRDEPRMSTVAPPPSWRASAMREFRAEGSRLFLTIEPIMDFDVDVLAGWVKDIAPEFVNIGADSKGCGLPEPSAGKILALIEAIREMGIEIRQKTNLARLLGTP